MTKNAERREKYKLLGARISAQVWKDRLMDHEYEIRGRAVEDPALSSRMFGPKMKCQQWERSSKVLVK